MRKNNVLAKTMQVAREEEARLVKKFLMEAIPSIHANPVAAEADKVPVLSSRAKSRDPLPF